MLESDWLILACSPSLTGSEEPQREVTFFVGADVPAEVVDVSGSQFLERLQTLSSFTLLLDFHS